MGFSLAAFAQLLDTISISGRTVIGVTEALATQDANIGQALVLRHDVDRLPSRAIHLATLEHKHGVAATYYFRASASGRFSSGAIRTIAGLGHEVGYHYETLSRCGGRMPEAVEAFQRNLEIFRGIAPCRTICMHGAPFSPCNNMDILDHLDMTALGLDGDAFRDMALRDPVYITDTGGRWNANKRLNRRDTIGASGVIAPSPANRAAFLGFAKATPRMIYITAHPERWPGSWAGQVQAELTDWLVNLAKQVLAGKA